MKRCIPLMILVSGLVLSVVFGSGLSANAAVTPGAMYEFDAGNNSGSTATFTNLGSLVGQDLVPIGSGVLFTAAAGSTPAYYTSNAGGTWNSEAGDNYMIEDFTAEIWVRRTGFASGNEHQLFGIADPTRRAQRVFVGQVGGKGNFNDDELDVFMEGSDAGNNFANDLGGSLLPLDQFVQLVYSWDDTTQVVSVYQNGNNLMGSANLPGVDMDGTLVQDHLSLFKFESGESASRRFIGDISLFRLYDSTLTGQQVQDNYDAVIPEPSSLVLIVLGILGMIGFMWNQRQK